MLHDVVRIGMMSFYLLLTLAVLFETRKAIRTLNAVWVFSQEMLPNGQLYESLILKKKLVRKHCLAATCYFMGVVACLYFI